MLEHLRNKTIPSHLAADAEDPYALIFVINDSKDEEGNIASESDILQASSVALVELLLNDKAQEGVQAWLEGRIRKIAKRARGAAWDKAADAEIFFTEATHGSATVRAYTPIPLSAQPPVLKKLQVTGLQSENTSTGYADEKSFLEVHVDEKLGMSTGKLVAQVGHAVQLFMMYGEESAVHTWLDDGSSIIVVKMDDLSEDADVAVHDAGFTEVAAGSLTCTADFIA